MTGLLTLCAVVATIALLVSATTTGAQATAGDPNKRGPWGIANWRPKRNRALNPHERRWQTTLLSGKDNPSRFLSGNENPTRWTTVVSEIAALEKLRGIEPAGPVPETYNNRWIEASIANLEASIHDTSIHTASINAVTPPGDIPQ